MRVCCVTGCDGPSNEEPVFFEFPTSRLLRKRWLDAIETSSKVAQDAVVCIRHFSSEDYELFRGKTRLRSKVVPKRLDSNKRNDNEAKKTAQESTEPVINDRTAPNKTTEETKLNNKDNDNNHNDNENNEVDNKHNRKVNDNSKDSDNIRIDKENNKKVSDKDNENASTIEKDNEKDSDKYKNNGEAQCDSLNSKNGQSDTENAHNSPEPENVNNDNNRLDNNDNGKDNNDNGGDKKALIDNGIVTKGKKTRCKITAMRVINGRKDSSQSRSSSSEDSVCSSPPPQPEIEMNKEDIEDALTNYYIENKKTERQVAAMADVLQEELEKREEKEEFQPSEPVFIELSVGQGSNAEGQPAENDCLMVLESVQCDVDPALLFADGEAEEIEQVDIDDDEPAVEVTRKEDPISLLTSSDEDDVIIEEPHFDTVEVSSAETSEDDMPLVKLVKTPNKKSGALHQKLIKQLMWGGTEYYCVQCRFTTVNCTEYTKHMAVHSKVLQICPDCGFTTCSKAQMTRHKHKHKNERRFKCTKCSYTARHEMSLVYHMKTHTNEVELAICDTFEPARKKRRSSGKSKLSEKKASKSGKKHKCDSCRYRTNRKSDMTRHRRRIHKDYHIDGESDE